ncbi:MAG: hypothetical protein GY822_05920 [Deltaproteobacteria bacterium]|nr:hypothetical protein [Deltaproteobacteria bacterium]
MIAFKRLERQNSALHYTSMATFLVLALSGVTLLSGCETMSFYDVIATPVEDCVVTPAGEFCGEVGGPVAQKYTVEFQDENTVLYFDEEVWLAPGTEGERVVVKEERITKDCTSIRRRTLLFNIGYDDNNNEIFVGTLEEMTRVDGPDVCGDTPFGTRLVHRLDGAPSSSF